MKFVYIGLAASLIAGCSVFSPKSSKLDLSGVNICGAKARHTVLPFNADKSGAFYSTSLTCNKNTRDVKIKKVILTSDFAAPKDSDYIGLIFYKKRPLSWGESSSPGIPYLSHAMMMKANIVVVDNNHELNDRGIHVLRAYFSEKELQKSS